MGRLEAIGVPGVDGAGEVMAAALLGGGWDRIERSGGAGLLDAILLAGKSIFKNFP